MKNAFKIAQHYVYNRGYNLNEIHYNLTAKIGVILATRIDTYGILPLCAVWRFDDEQILLGIEEFETFTLALGRFTRFIDELRLPESTSKTGS